MKDEFVVETIIDEKSGDEIKMRARGRRAKNDNRQKNITISVNVPISVREIFYVMGDQFVEAHNSTIGAFMASIIEGHYRNWQDPRKKR